MYIWPLSTSTASSYSTHPLCSCLCCLYSSHIGILSDPWILRTWNWGPWILPKILVMLLAPLAWNTLSLSLLGSLLLSFQISTQFSLPLGSLPWSSKFGQSLRYVFITHLLASTTLFYFWSSFHFSTSVFFTKSFHLLPPLTS